MTVITGVAVRCCACVWRRWTPLVLMVIAVGGSLAMTVVGKRITDRTRPPHWASVPPYETSASFPSGHPLNSIVIAGMFCYLLVSHLTSRVARGRHRDGTVLYRVAMGLSRVYLGHHWLTDVLAAWCLGIAWLTVVITCHRLWLTQHRDRVRRARELGTGPSARQEGGRPRRGRPHPAGRRDLPTLACVQAAPGDIAAVPDDRSAISTTSAPSARNRSA